MKRVYFVLGLENSGNRMMVQAFCSAGCYGNPHTGELLGEKVEDLKPNHWPDQVVFARSVLHGGEIPNPISLVQPMLQSGFEVVPIHIYRKTDFAIDSHVMHNYAPNIEVAFQHLDLCVTLVHDLGVYLDQRVTTIIYELFVRLPDYRAALFSQLGLSAPVHPFFNANDKYELSHAAYSI